MHQRALAAQLDSEEELARPEPAPVALLRAATPAAVISMQRTAGNRAVQTYISTSNTLSRQTEAPPRTDANVAQAIADRDIGAIKDIGDFSGASDVQRLQMIEILLDQFWVGPYDEAALVARRALQEAGIAAEWLPAQASPSLRAPG